MARQTALQKRPPALPRRRFRQLRYEGIVAASQAYAGPGELSEEGDWFGRSVEGREPSRHEDRARPGAPGRR
jgi:hypothetical protein